jgi:hypothetical protein
MEFFTDFTDFGAHLGGAIMGILFGFVLFCGYLEQKILAFVIGSISLAIAIALYIGSIYYLFVLLKPTDEYNEYFLADDWESHKPLFSWLRSWLSSGQSDESNND